MTKKPTKTAKKLPVARHKAKQSIKHARPLHHQVLLHPFTVFILLCAGVFISNWTFSAAADTLNVSAKVAAPALTTGATITQPLNGAVVTTTPITISGGCPDNSYITLERNGSMSGVAWCIGNTYSITTSLFPGANNLRVQAYNITDDPGPTTPAIDITYNVPSTPPPGTPPSQPQPSAPPKPATQPAAQAPKSASLPTLISKYTYQTFATNTNFAWNVDILGGTPHFKLSTSWGDGAATTHISKQTQAVGLEHKYTKPGYFTVLIKLLDANGYESVLQLIAIIKSPVSSNILSSNAGAGGAERYSIFQSGKMIAAQHALVLAWGSYATVSLMAFSFWLGERQKIATLMRLKGPRHHRA